VDAASILSLAVIALVAVFTSVTAPLILVRRSEQMHREDLQADYQRQDRIAAVAAGTAAAMLAVQRDMAQAMAIRDDRASAKLDLINAQAQSIHTLVNSDMTAARQSELDQTRAMLTVLRRVVDLSKARGQAPDPRDLDALAAAETRATELEQILADRLYQLRQVEADAVENPVEEG